MESTQWGKINTFIFDVDGVFTDGNFIYTADGKFAKIFGPHDADGIKLLRQYGINIQAISADKRGFSITKKRIEEDMGVPLELVSEWERLQWLQSRFKLKECVYMGDGFHDMKIFENVGYSIAPINAFYLTKEKADYVTKTPAGAGAVLEWVLHVLEKLYNITIS